MADDVLDAALAFHHAGICVIPAAADGTKAPDHAWKRYTRTRPTEHQLHAWFGNGHPGIGIVCGAVSGNLICLDVENRAITEGVWDHYQELAANSGLGTVLRTVTDGYTEQTASGGLHLLWRVNAPVPGNQKLARRPATPDELANGGPRVQVLIETRAENGFAVVAPSHGPVHPTGQPWTLLAGGPDTIATLTADHSNALLELARMCDTTPAPATQFTQPATPHDPTTGTRPGDDYEARTDWTDILTPHGWTEVHRHGRTRYWRRPGKTLGISATTGHADDRDRLYVFTTSTEFDAEVPYTKFAAHALLNHGGDHAAAARDLAARGYGTPPPEPRRPLHLIPGGIDGTTALAPTPAPTAEAAPDTYTRTDDGNALRLVDTYHDRIRYVPQRGAWLTWTGHRWAWDDHGTVHELARTIARTLPDTTDLDTRHRNRSLSAKGLTAMVQVARTDPRILAPAPQLDANPHLLNTPSGVVDLRTGLMRPPDPTQLHTRTTSVAPDPTLPTPRWTQFLTDMVDPTLHTYLQRLAGYSASADVGHHVLPFLFGPGGNGKSVFLDVLRALLGDYATTAPHDFLMAGRTQHETEIARLQGMRLVICAEVNADDRFDEAKIKALTGGDTLTARFMRQDHFTFEPTHHLWLMGNHRPQVRAGGPSFWRRLRLLPFDRHVPPERRIDNFARLLVAEEGPGILAWAIRGAVDYFTGGINEPDTVRAATASYAAEEDHVGRFLDDECHVAVGLPQVRVETKRLRAAYEAWCLGEGIKPLTAQALGRELAARGIVRKTSSGRKFYEGVALLDDGSDERGSAS